MPRQFVAPDSRWRQNHQLIWQRKFMNHVFTIATDTTAGVPVWLQIQSAVTRSPTGGIVSVAAVWRRVELGREQRAKSGDRWRDWRTRSAAASEAAKREQLVLERRSAKAILRMEGVIQSGLRMGGSSGHVSAARDLMGAYLDEAG